MADAQGGDENADLTAMVQTLLGQMQDKFQGMSDKIVSKYCTT